MSAKSEPLTRRAFLGRLGAGAAAGAAGFALAPMARRLRPSPLPRARRVIYLHLAGSPSQLDLFDHKPELARHRGERCPPSLVQGMRFAFQKPDARILPSPYAFARHGDSGMWFSELLPHTASIADHLTCVRSMHTDQFNHAPAQLLLQTGSPLPGRPAFGAWVDWALGSDNRDLPGFVVLTSGGPIPSAGASIWGSGFLPTRHQGVRLRTAGEPVLFLQDPAGVDRAARRRSLDLIADLDRLEFERNGDPETATRMAQYELAYRMQRSVPAVCDLAREPDHVLRLYGAEPGKASFANNCLLARRLIENGVRFVQLYDWGWDGHGTGPNDDLLYQLPRKCGETDRPFAALVADLDRRGLLDETLVVWGGEFGRTMMNEERDGSKFLGRDHHPHCFTMLLAGGGLRRGLVHGATDELGFSVVEDGVHVHDLQATLLHLLGLDHERLTFRYQGRDFRLTDVAGRVVEELLT